MGLRGADVATGSRVRDFYSFILFLWVIFTSSSFLFSANPFDFISSAVPFRAMSAAPLAQIPKIELKPTTMPGLDEHGEPRFLENVKMFLERAAKKTSIPDDVYEIIESCASVIRFNVPLVMDNGELRTVTCYRAQHSTH